jgi:hypothetical protein
VVVGEGVVAEFDLSYSAELTWISDSVACQGSFNRQISKIESARYLLIYFLLGRTV